MPSVTVRKSGSLPSGAQLPGDGTRQLLVCGVWMLAVGVASVLLARFVFGGIGPQGPHTSSGWLALMAALVCLPFGCVVTLLGAAKWLRNYHPQGRNTNI